MSVSIEIRDRKARERSGLGNRERSGAERGFFFPPSFFILSQRFDLLLNLDLLNKKNTKQTSSPVPPRDLHAQVQARRQDHGPLHGHADRRHQVRLVARPVRERKREKRARRREAREESKERFCLFVLLFSLSFSRSHSLSKNQNSKKKNSGDPFVFTLGAGQVIKGKGNRGRKTEKKRHGERTPLLAFFSLPLSRSLSLLFSFSFLSFFSFSSFHNQQAGMLASTRCASARSASSRSPRTWATVSSFLKLFYRERFRRAKKEGKKKLTLLLSNSFSQTPKNRRDGLPAQDPRRRHADL